MTWQNFFDWLGANGFIYSQGDVHYAGRGYWFPQTPDITTGDPAPRPPAPWIGVQIARGETRADPEVSVFIVTSFSPGGYAETPKQAQDLIFRTMLQYDEHLGAGPYSPLEPGPSLPPPRSQPQRRSQVMDRLEQESRERIERAWEQRHGPGIAKVRAAQEREARRREREGVPQIVNRRVEGLSSDDSDVSDCCDLGAHERCLGCGCGCHIFKVCRTCRREYSQEDWDDLPLLGKQMTGDREYLDLKNCSCGSTMAVEGEAE